MAKDYVWKISVDIIQTRSRGVDMAPEPVFTYTYDVESDHALSVAEGLERCVAQERME